jgi:hypothetical protein
VRLADEPASFAGAVVRLLRDADARARLETAARALVVEQYDWSAVAGSLESALLRFALRQAQGGHSVSLSARAEPVDARATGQL